MALRLHEQHPLQPLLPAFQLLKAVVVLEDLKTTVSVATLTTGAVAWIAVRNKPAIGVENSIAKAKTTGCRIFRAIV
jgi:hypothetical protein